MDRFHAIYDKFQTVVLWPISRLLFSAALLLFIYGLVEFMYDPNDKNRRETGKRHMIYGVLGLLVMVSVWGIIHLITGTLGLQRDPSTGLFR